MHAVMAGPKMGGVCVGKVGTASVSSMLVGEVPFGRPQALGDREASLAKLVGSRLHVPMCWD